MPISQRRKWGSKEFRSFVQVGQQVRSSPSRTSLSPPPTLSCPWRDLGPWFPKSTTQLWCTYLEVSPFHAIPWHCVSGLV